VKDLALPCLAKMVHWNHIYLIPKSQEPKIHSVEAREFFPIFWPAINQEPCGRSSLWIHPNTLAKVVYRRRQPITYILTSKIF
jgi:hypothetical protein